MKDGIEIPDDVRRAAEALDVAARRYAATLARGEGRYESKSAGRVALRRAARAYADAMEEWEGEGELIPVDTGDE